MIVPYYNIIMFLREWVIVKMNNNYWSFLVMRVLFDTFRKTLTATVKNNQKTGYLPKNCKFKARVPVIFVL